MLRPITPGRGSLTAQSGASCSSTQQLVDCSQLQVLAAQSPGPVTVLQHSHILQDSHCLRLVLLWVAWQESTMKSCARKFHRECIRREKKKRKMKVCENTAASRVSQPAAAQLPWRNLWEALSILSNSQFFSEEIWQGIGQSIMEKLLHPASDKPQSSSHLFLLHLKA